MNGRTALLLTFCLLPSAFCLSARAAPFVITVEDEQTHRGVPLVELTTVNNQIFVTDSAGVVAFDEPGLLGQRVYFGVKSHGYEYPKDGFGFRGVTLDTKPGGAATIKINRLNVAQRLYRITGQGIYRDTVLAGRTPPLKDPVLNAQVLGQDTVQRVLYRGKLHWFWGDTNRAAYPLGHFGMSGAVSDLPGEGGLDPSVGVDLRYFTDKSGFARPMIPGPDLRWAFGFMVLKDPAGVERLVAKVDMLKSLTDVYARKLIVYDDATDTFTDLAPLAKDEPLCPNGHPFRHTDAGVDYFYFPGPGPCYPALRVRADWESVKTPAAYEGFACLTAGSRYDKANAGLDRDAAGALVWAWKKNTPPLTLEQQSQLIKTGAMKPAEAWYQLKDVETKDDIKLQAGSAAWNPFKKKWILIATQIHGKPSELGEIWYSEADQPQGPYRWARRIVTHDRYTFYNPVHHPFFDQDAGRTIYFEGTYCNTFSGNPYQTPRYDYNQIMYRLDLSDGRLKLP